MMFQEEKMKQYSARDMGMIYNKCATIICEEFGIDLLGISGSGPKKRFYAAIEALRATVSTRSEDIDEDSDLGEAAAGRWELDDVAPNKFRAEFYKICKEKRRELKENGSSSGVYSFRDIARDVFDGIASEFPDGVNRRINVVKGNYDRAFDYMDEIVESSDWIVWYGRGVRLNTRKLKIVV